GGEVPVGRIDRRVQLGAQALEAGDCERVQQRLTVAEVTPRRRMAHPDLTSQLTQRQLVLALLAQGLLGGAQKGVAEAAVVIGAFLGLGHARILSMFSLTTLVGTAYIVVHD